MTKIDKKHWYLATVMAIGSTVLLLALWLLVVRKDRVVSLPTPPIQAPTSSLRGTERIENVELTTLDSQWWVGKRYLVSVVLKPVFPPPTAVDLQLLFEPEVLQVERVNPGNVWSDTNVLQNKINNQDGEVLFSLGQGFDATTTGNNVLATIEFTVLTSSQSAPIIRLGDESLSASVGSKETVLLYSLPLKLNIL